MKIISICLRPDKCQTILKVDLTMCTSGRTYIHYRFLQQNNRSGSICSTLVIVMYMYAQAGSLYMELLCAVL